MAEQVTRVLSQFVGRSGHITAVSGITQRMDLAVLEHCGTTTENKIHSTFYEAVFVVLPHSAAPAQRIQEEAFIASDQIVRQGTGKQCILRRS